jgi:hypothetical protein
VLFNRFFCLLPAGRANNPEDWSDYALAEENPVGIGRGTLHKLAAHQIPETWIILFGGQRFAIAQ